MAEEVGLTINDVELSFLDAPTQVTAFETKAIDAAYAVEPRPARFTERRVAVRFRTPDQVKGLGPVQVGVIIYSGKFNNERRPVAQRLNGCLKAAELFHNTGTKDPEIAAILEKYTKVPAKVIQSAVPPYQDPNGRVLRDNLADQAQWFASNGMQQQKVSIDSALDLSFLK
jgi:ABC-type nitrate/sulfonate/bicarbonate transport system substrate-binding protein